MNPAHISAADSVSQNSASSANELGRAISNEQLSHHPEPTSPSSYSAHNASTEGLEAPLAASLTMQSSRASMIQIRKEQKKSLNRFPKKGYRITTTYFYQEVDSHWTALMVITCFGISGMLDAVTFGAWGIFTAMQTGNTIFLALRITNGTPSTHHEYQYTKSLVSIGCYCIGAFLFNCLHRIPTGLSDPHVPLHRWTLTTSFLLQSTLLGITAILAQTNMISTEAKGCRSFSTGPFQNNQDNYYLDLVGIAILALESSGQVCLSRVLLVNELPTIVVSTLYHDLIAEGLSARRSWKKSETVWDFLVDQKKQIRRAACILSLFGGAAIGGSLFRTKGRLMAVLWLAAGIKIIITVTWCLWRGKPIKETIVTETDEAVLDTNQGLHQKHAP